MRRGFHANELSITRWIEREYKTAKEHIPFIFARLNPMSSSSEMNCKATGINERR